MMPLVDSNKKRANNTVRFIQFCKEFKERWTFVQGDWFCLLEGAIRLFDNRQCPAKWKRKRKRKIKYNLNVKN